MGEITRYLDPGEERLARPLWRQSFPEDSEEFDDYYFSKKIKKSRILVKEEDGEIIAMLHRNPYRIRLGDCGRELDYIVGVATRADRRHRGHMRDLLVRMLNDAAGEGKPFCFLMPASEAIYSPFGFRFVFDQPSWELADAGAVDTAEKPAREYLGDRKAEAEEIAAFMDAWLDARYEVYAERDREYAEMLMEELASEDGVVRQLYSGGVRIGIQAFSGLADREQRFLYCAEPWVRETGRKPAIMARVADLKGFLELFRLSAGADRQLDAVLAVTDPLVRENEGVWRWRLGTDGSAAWRVKEDPKTADEELLLAAGTGTLALEPALSCDVSELIQWLMGYRSWEALRPDEDVPDWCKRVRPMDGVFLDEVV